MAEVELYPGSWRGRGQRGRRDDVVAARHATRVTRRLVLTAVRERGAWREVPCGSLARGGFRLGSDIDLSVEGIREDRCFAASARAARGSGGFEVDLISLQGAAPACRRHVDEGGIVQHEATGA